MESPGQDQQTEGQLHPSGCQEDKLPPDPPPLPSFAPRITELLPSFYNIRICISV